LKIRDFQLFNTSHSPPHPQGLLVREKTKTQGGFVMQATASASTYPAFYSVEDVQRLLGVGRNSAYKLVAEKDFPAIYVGNRIVIPADLFGEWVNRQATQRRGGGSNGKRPQR
jgi:excisionase family DNA binding protein